MSRIVETYLARQNNPKEGFRQEPASQTVYHNVTVQPTYYVG